MPYPQDAHSFARPDEAAVTHLDLTLTVDFAKKMLSGSASWKIRNEKGGNRLILDTKDLAIERVTLEDGQKTRFRLGKSRPYLGRPLVIDIKPNTERVTVYYHTSPEAEALQWLSPRQTAGGKFPYLFTQSEAILARTWVPCQDSPGIRFTYNARIKTDPNLLVVMSASNPQKKNASGEYQFSMPQPIPSYLLAMAVGDLQFRAISQRSGVYAEPSVIKKAAWELADTEKMIAAAEALYGPYRWERYDIIVLPPSFPFGGMENPRLTFATPTILAGDRSLVSLIAHELAHSWSGNLVTNANWNDFWLNEGFTVYFEHRIMEAVYGRDYEEMLAFMDLQDLKKSVQKMGPENPDTQLHLNLDGRSPDDGMTDIAYNKGYFFLRMLEENVGRKKWDQFLRGYFDKFAFQSMTSEKFVDYLKKNLLQNNGNLAQKLKIDAWVFQPGLPANCPTVHSTEFDKVEKQIDAFKHGTPAGKLKTGGWTTHHWLHFLRSLPEKLSRTRMEELDRAYHFTETGNSEILEVWLLKAVANRYEPAYPALKKFLTEQGRRKFLRPLYAKLAETPQGKKMALEIYRQARPGYHSVSYLTIDKILGWKADRK